MKGSFIIVATIFQFHESVNKEIPLLPALENLSIGFFCPVGLFFYMLQFRLIWPLLVVLLFGCVLPNRVLGDSVKPSPPSVSYSNSINFDFTSNVFQFFYTGADGALEYDYAPVANGSFNPLHCTVNGTNTFRPSNVGGLSLVSNAMEIFPWQNGVLFQLLDAHSNNSVLFTTWKMSSGTNNLTYTYQFQISGRTLSIQATATNGVAGGVYLDRCEDATNPVIIHVPYLTTMNVLLAGGAFGSMFFDWENTSASTLYPLDSVYSTSSVYYAQQALYLPRTDGTRRSVNETIYLTVSPSLPNVLPNVPNPVSPCKSMMANVLVFDDWQTPFATVNTNVQTLHNAGLTNLWVIVHQWQNGGYDTMYPDVLPASVPWGGDAGLDALSQTIRTNGYLFALHENYVDFYPNAPSWNTNAIALNSNGSLKQAWSNSTTQIQSYEIKPTLAASYLNIFAPQIHSNYTTTASFLDVHSAVNPSDKVDYDAGVTNAAMFSETLSRYRALFGLLRGYHQGPVSGEGLCHFLHVGYIDDVEAQINCGSSSPATSGSWLPLLVDFELLKLHGKTLTHGVGYYERFFADENNTAQYLTAAKDDVLKYMATELAYGHGGFIPDPDRVFDLAEVGQLEQRHTFAAQQLYANAMPTSILYYDPASNDLVTVSDYIRRYPTTFDKSTNANFMSQLQVTYDNGVVVCVNRHPSQSWAVQLGQPGGTFNFNAVLNGTNTQWVGVTNLTSYLLPATNGWVVFAPNLTPPIISTVTLTNGILTLGLTNLLAGNSNHVERCSSLPSTNWQVVDTFVSAGTQTNWSQSVTGNGSQSFYRVVRFW